MPPPPPPPPLVVVMVVVLPPPRLPRLGLSPPIEDCAAAASAAATVAPTFVVVLLPAPPPRLPRLPLSPPGASSSCLFRLDMAKQYARFCFDAEWRT